jgi:hypothetical protein
MNLTRALPRTAGVLLLGAALASPAALTSATLAQDGAAATAAQNAPSAEKVLDQALKAMGGKEAFKKINSRHMKMTISGQQPAQQQQIETWSMGDDKMLIQMSVMGMNVTMGRNGDVAWVNAPGQGTSQVPIEQAEQNTSLTQMHSMVQELRKNFKTIETVGSAEAGGEEAWKIRVADRKEENPMQPQGELFVYFNKKTHLPVMTEVPLPQGQGMAKQMFKDWKNVGDLKLFHTMEIQQGPMTQTLKIDAIEFNNVDEAKFAIPEEIKAQQPATQPGG